MTTKILRQGRTRSCGTACTLTAGRRPWPSDPRYFVGDDGSIAGPGGALLTPTLDHNGYLRVGMGSRFLFVHVVVAETFHGPRPEGKRVAHANGVRTDCRAENLSWKTPVENEADKILHGTHLQGVRVASAKLDDDKVRAIRAAGSAGGMQGVLARRYGVDQTTISSVLLRETWRHI